MNKRNIIIWSCIVLAAGVSWLLSGQGQTKAPVYKRVTPFHGKIESAISATGRVQPQNRLAIKPPVGGRIEEIIVDEGQKVKAGDILALMSSTDRAALMDAARLQGEEAVKHWEDVYKPTPLIAPIDGEVIVKAADPGQTVTQSDVVLVLSDRLIVQAQVDETDIGKVKPGQEAVITLDAYPAIEVRARVEHIAYESTTVSNVTIYSVDIVPRRVPDVFRSGMSANVRIVQEVREGLLLVPQQAVKKEKGKSYVLLAQGRGRKPVRRDVQLGLSDGDNIEVAGGLTSADTILMTVAAYSSSRGAAGSGSNPFMPSPPGGRRGAR